MDGISNILMNRIRERFAMLYGSSQANRCVGRLIMMVGRYGVGANIKSPTSHWTEQDRILITYGDMVQSTDKTPLATLEEFVTHRIDGAVNSVHILPFFPYSSDDGFSVINYRQVREDLGDWDDVKSIGQRYKLMSDLVLNHVSRKSGWFSNFVAGIAPFRDYFIEVDPEADLSQVTRPRSTPLLSEVWVYNEKKFVWCTFSDDQIDVNFANPDVLFEFLDILFWYIANGVRIIRLDAIAYLWKRIGTTCIHLPETHEVVKLFRDVLKIVAPDVLLMTETNVPHEENVSYFGEGDEAHMVYQFSLPPLLLHALLTGQTKYITEWAQKLQPPPEGCTFFNFTASHDGVGVRPLEGIVPDEEILALGEAVDARGGQVSMRRKPDGTDAPYELNITYLDALGEPQDKGGAVNVERFLCSQTVAMAMQGVPGVYFHSLVGTRNDYEGLADTGRARSINRRKYQLDDLEAALDGDTHQAAVLEEYSRRLRLRGQHPAFHPNGPQIVMDLVDGLFNFIRIAPDSRETILCLNNFRNRARSMDLKNVESLRNAKEVYDVLSGETFAVTDKVKLAAYQSRWLALK